MTSNFKGVLGIILTVSLIILSLQSVSADYSWIVETAGSYDLNRTMPENTTSAVYINASNVLINCSEYEIIGNETLESYGFYIDNVSNVTILNCNISNMDLGIYLYDSNDSIITNSKVAYSLRDSIFIGGKGNTIKDSIILNNRSDIAGININSTQGYNLISNMTLNLWGVNDTAINFTDTSAGYNNITSSHINVTGTCINNIQGTENIILNNTFQGSKWIDNQGTTTFNTSTYGNTYYLSSGNGSWTLYDIRDLNGDGYADIGSARPFNGTNVGSYWTGLGEDWFPRIVDNENPAINYTGGTDYESYTTKNYIFINTTATDINLINLSISIYNSTLDLINYSSTNESNIYINITELFEGTYFFNTTARDSLNHTNSTTTRNVTIDFTRPSIYFGPDTDNGTIVNRSEIIINITVIDQNLANTTVRIYNATGNIENVTFSTQQSIFINYTVPADGQYFFNATSLDKAHNSNDSFTLNVTTNNATPDIIDPSIAFNADTDNTIYSSRGYITINVSASDDSGIANITIYIYNRTRGLVNETFVTGANASINYTTVTPTQGIYFFNATVYDNTGRKNSTETRNVTIDTILPSITIGTPSSTGFSANDTLIVNISITDANLANSTINIYNSTGYLINSTFNTTSNIIVVLTNLGEGTYYYNATSTDMAGNLNHSATQNATIDLASPAIEFKTPSETGISGAGSIAINVSANETNIANITLRLYDSTGAQINLTISNNTQLYVNYTGLTDGTYYYNATSFDQAGRSNHTETRNITIDLTNPSIAFVGNTDNTPYANKNYITFNITADDTNYNYTIIHIYNSAGAQVSIYQNTAYNFSNNTFLSDGLYYFNATAYDLAGHYSNTSTRNITLDTTNPTVIFNTDSDNSSLIGRDNIYISANASDTNYANITITLYNLTHGLVNMTINTTANHTAMNTTGLADGIYYYNATTYDLAGNKANTSTRNITIDTTNPILILSYPTDNDTIIDRRDIRINISSSDAHFSNITIQLFNDSMQLENLTYEYTQAAFVTFNTSRDGIYYYNVTSYDTSGHLNNSGLRNVTIDTTVPGIIFDEGTDNVEYSPYSDIIINVTANDTNILNVTIYLYNTFGTLRNTTNDTQANLYDIYGPLPEGRYFFNATVYDKAGHSNSTSTKNITLDFSDPEVRFNISTDTGIMNRSNIHINVTVVDDNTENITAYVYNSTGNLVNTTIALSQNRLEFTTQTLSEGIYFYNATSYDKAGNNGTSVTQNVTIDLTSPSIYFSEDSDNSSLIGRNSIYLSANASDANFANITIKLYNATGQVEKTTTNTTANHTKMNTTGLADGTYYYNATAYDLAGNRNSTATRNITIDTTAPVIEFKTPTDTGIISRNYTTINVSVNETHIENITINIYNSTHNLINTTTSTGNNAILSQTNLADGTYYYNATSYDTLGHYSNTSTQNFTVNTLLPSITFVNATSGVIGRNYLEINATATGSISYIILKIYNSTGLYNATNTTANNLYINLTGLAEDNYIYNATVVDISENIANSDNISVAIDLTNPSIAFIGNTDNTPYTNRSYITLNISASDAHFSNIIFYIYESNGNIIVTNITTNDSLFNNSFLPDGIYFFNATVYDMAGHPSNTSTRNITIDTISPTISFTEQTTSNTPIGIGTITIETVADDINIANSTIKIYNSTGNLINSTTNASSNASITITGLADGIYFFNATATDLAGNFNNTDVNETVTRNVTIDTTAPVIEFKTPTDTGTISRNYTTINVSVNETHIANITITIYNASEEIVISRTMNAVNITTINSVSIVTINKTDLPNGIYFYNATSYDTLGHYANSSTQNFTVNTQIPTISFTQPSDTGYINRTYIQINTTTTGSGITLIVIRLYNSTHGLVNTSNTTTQSSLEMTVINLAQGIYYYNATVYDSLNNTANSITTPNVTIDTTAPSIDVYYHPFEFQAYDSISIDASITELNPGNNTIDIYNSTRDLIYSTSSLGVLLNNRSEGIYYYNVTSTDLAGNTNNSTTYNVTVDLTDPVVEFKQPSDTGMISRNYITINISINETNIANATIRLYNGTGNEINSTFSENNTVYVNYTGLADGIYSYDTTVGDRGGRLANQETRNVTIDTTAPIIEFKTPTDTGVVPRGYIRINVSVNESNIANITINVYNATGQLDRTMTTYALTSAEMNTSGLADGIYFYNITSYDTLGHYSNTSTRNVTINTNLPTISFTSPSDTVYINRTYIQINTTTTGSGIALIVIRLYNSTRGLINTTNTTTLSSLEMTVINLAQGIYYYNATVYDSLNNTETTGTQNATIDTINPSISFIGNTDNGGMKNTSQIIINVTADDTNHVNITVYIYNSSRDLIYSNSTINTTSINNTAYYSYSVSNGLYYFNATATDLAGRKSSTPTRNITINVTDANAPSIAYLPGTESSGSIITRDNIYISVYSNDTNLAYTYIYIYTLYNGTINLINTTNSTYNSSTWTFNYTVPSDGTYYFNATSFDDDGNSNSTSTRNVTIDRTNPTIQFIGNTDNTSYASKNYITFNITANDANYANMQVYIYDSAGVQIWTTAPVSNKNFSNNSYRPSDGLYYFNATVTDLVGHTSSTETRNITLDTTNPIIAFHSSSDTGIIGRNNIYISANATDTNIANITIKVYNSTGSLKYNTTTSLSYNTFINITGLSDGIYYYNATAYDLAGNHVNTSTRNVTIDSSIPVITIISPTNQIYNTSIINLNIYVNSSQNTSACYYYIDGSTTMMSNCTGALLNLTEGMKSLTVYSNDTLGLVGQATVAFMIDINDTIIEANTSTIEVNDTNSTQIYIPANNTVETITISQNVSDDTSVKIFFAGISSNSTQSNITLNSSMNASRNTTSVYALELPANVTITGPSNWTGEIVIPTTTTETVTITATSGMTVTQSKAIIVGFNQRLNLSRAARIVIGGEAGKLAGYDEGSGAVTRITYTCPNATDQDIIDDYLNDTITECYINYGNDLIIWTRHFSRYVTFTESTTPSAPSHSSSSSSSSGGGGGGGAAISTNASTEADTATVSEYIPSMLKGSRSIILDKTGMPITKIILNINSDTSIASRLEVSAQTTNPTNGSVENSTIYKYITFESTMDDTLIDSIEYRFKVDKTWLSQHNLTADNITIYRYLNGAWIRTSDSTKPSIYSEDTGYKYYSMTTQAGFVTFAIGGPLIKIMQKTEETAGLVQNNNTGTVTINVNPENTSTIVEKKHLNWSKITTGIGSAASSAGSAIGHAASVAAGAIGKAFNVTTGWVHETVSGMAISRSTWSLIIIAVSSIIILGIGVASGIIIYKNTIKPKLAERKEAKARRRHAAAKSTTSEIVEKEDIIAYEKENESKAEKKQQGLESQTIDSEKPFGASEEHADVRVRQIHELLNKCEYALSKGMIDQANEYYNDARTTYFGTGLTYEQKSVVYLKMMELHGKLSKIQK